MELLLTVGYGMSSAPTRVDVAVELDPFTSVALLRDALAAYGE